jgi:uncharacterized membrane protein
MKNFTKVGRVIFAIAIIGFGIEHFINGNFPSALMAFPEFPGQRIFVYVVGLLLVLCGLSIITDFKSRIASLLLGLLYIPFLIAHIYALLLNIKNPGPWTTGGEIMALMGGAWIIAGSLPKDGDARLNKVIPAGRYFFVALLIVVCAQHFMYAEFISFLIPEWIPARLFLAYLVGVVFLATVVSLLMNVRVHLSMMLLSIMFLIWVIILHAPRVVASMDKEPEWSSLFVALAMSGISLVLVNQSRADKSF